LTRIAHFCLPLFAVSFMARSLPLFARAKSAANNWFYSKACRGLPPFYGAPGEFDALADDRLERAVVERFNALGLTPDAGSDRRLVEAGFAGTIAPHSPSIVPAIP
jgi:hypothetical protein